jgi:DNA-binding NarL/FixJ family response regulator
VLDDVPLVARERQLARATGVLADGGPWAVQVAGPAGMGKSRLLRELRTIAESRGHLVLPGRAADFDAEPAFGIVRHALDDWLRSLPAAERERLVADDAAELAAVLPTAGAPGSDDPLTAQERHRGYDALRRLLHRAAEQRPVLLVLDDVHWADAASIELLVHLHARPPRGAVRVVLGFRPAQLPAQLGRAAAAAVREEEAVRIDLEPLDLPAALRVLGDGVPEQVARQLHQESGGTPFFLLALARAYLQGERRAGPAPDGGHVPDAVRVALAGELDSLPPDALRLLRGAAVAGDPWDVLTAARAAELEPEAVPWALEALLTSGLALASETPRALVFRHPIVRDAVLADAGVAWAARAHGQVARHLEAHGAPPTARAPHLERSALPGDAAAIATLRAAGDALVRRAPSLAARWFAAAATLVPEDPASAPERIALRLQEAEAATSAGELERGSAALGAVLELLPADDPQRPVVVAQRAGVEHLLGRHRDAHARLSTARAGAGPGTAAAVLLDLELAACAGFETRPPEMLERARAARDAADALGRPELAAAAAGQMGMASYFLGVPLDEVLDDGARRFAALDDAELADRLDLGLWLGWTEAVCERHEASLATTDRVLRVVRETGRGSSLLLTRTAAAWSLLRLGRLAEAERMIDAAIETGRVTRNLFLSVSLGQRAILRLAQGRVVDAVADGEESVRLVAHADPGLIPGMSGFYLAAPLLAAGRHGEARAALLAQLDGDHLRTSRSGEVPACEVLVRAALADGDLAEARRWADRAVAATHGGHLLAEDAHAQRAVAEVAIVAGEPDVAAERAMAAAARSAAASLPIEAGRCETVAGRALAAAGRRDEAAELLRRAADRLGAIGAHGWSDAADLELRRLGRRRRTAPRGTSAGLGALTEREHQIAQLVRAGLRNRQIADRLYISEKTVERTLSAAFAKLGVGNRAALAAALADARVPAGDHRATR